MLPRSFNAGEAYPIAQWRSWNDELKRNVEVNHQIMKAATEAGYPTQAQASTGAFPQLVPQSIDSMLVSQTYDESMITFWPTLTQVPVWSTLHEATVQNQHGDEYLDPFMTESKSPSSGDGEYERKTVQVKYFAEKRELSDVANLIGTIEGRAKGLAIKTREAITALTGKLESALFFADSSVNPLHFDGLISQINGGPNADIRVSDNRGAATSPQDLTQILYGATEGPTYAPINEILVEPTLLGDLITIATSQGRFSQPTQQSVASGQGFTLVHNPSGLFLGGPRGLVPIKAIPKMYGQRKPKSTNGGDAPPTVFSSFGSVTPGAHASSEFTATDAGDYVYKVVAVGDKGYSAPVTSGTISVSAGDRVAFTIADAAAPASGDASIRYYRVYRTPKNVTDASQATWIFDVAVNDAGGSDETIFYDTNAAIEDTSTVFLLTRTARTMYWAKFLDMFRRPLAQPEPTVPFLVMQFGSLFVKAPNHQFMIKNVSRNL